MSYVLHMYTIVCKFINDNSVIIDQYMLHSYVYMNYPFSVSLNMSMSEDEIKIESILQGIAFY